MHAADAYRAKRRSQGLIGTSIAVVVLVSIAGCFEVIRSMAGGSTAALISSLYGIAAVWGGFWTLNDMRTFEPFVDVKAQFEMAERRQRAEREELHYVAEILRSDPEMARRYEQFKKSKRASLLDSSKPGLTLPWP
ncbi:hypothetical protein KDX01_07980 [Burkholderia vietnamiensis]|uniref:hypothetical protein n=1 Tax=Burkholderia vietnamiensis TaxID=60552 RepID=UPI001B982EF9|nr:hypothetical protein [Burkholderia vietnamiensis]MBR7973048.1 hypothetical protein [Burkholderia vietnamiensis]